MNYYVYTLSRPNGSVFYVGKGAGKRSSAHEIEARKGCDCHKCRIIRKIWRNGGEVQKQIIYTTNDELDALRYERALVERIGLTNLANVNPGGQFERPPVRGLPDKSITEITDAEYVAHLRNIVGMTPARLRGMLESWRVRKIQILERQLKSAKFNLRMNGHGDPRNIERIEGMLDDLYIALGWINQHQF